MTIVRVSVEKTKDLPRLKEMDELICNTAREGTPAMEIANELTRRGYHSARSERVLKATVTKVRLNHRILRDQSVTHRCQKAAFITVPILANTLGVDRSWILERIYDGTIDTNKNAERHCDPFRDTPETIATFQALICAFRIKTTKPGGPQDESSHIAIIARRFQKSKGKNSHRPTRPPIETFLVAKRSLPSSRLGAVR